MTTVFLIVKIASIVSPILAIVLFLRTIRRQLPLMWLLFVLLLIGLTSDVIAFYLGQLKQSTAVVSNIFILMQFILVGLIYTKVLTKNTAKYVTPIVAGASALFVLNGIIFQPITSVQSANWIVCSLMIMAFSFIHLVEMSSNPVYKVSRYAAFWVTNGLFFYCSVGFIAISLGGYLANHASLDTFRFVWLIHNFANIFKNMCFAAAIWWAPIRETEIDHLIQEFNEKKERSTKDTS